MSRKDKKNQNRSDKQVSSKALKRHLPTMFAYYAAASFLFALGCRSATTASFAIAPLLEGLAGFFIAFAVLAVVLYAIRLEHKHIAGPLLENLNKFKHFLLAWAGLGLAGYGAGQLAGGKKLSVSAAVFSGPFSAFSSALTILIAFAFTAAIILLLEHHKLAHFPDGKFKARKLVKNMSGATGSSGLGKADKEEPKGAHYAQTTKAVSRYVIPSGKLPARLAMAEANLADDWNRKLMPRDIGLPTEGSAVVIGAPGAGKTAMTVKMLLSLEATSPDCGYLPTRVIGLSTKPDLIDPTQAWLKSQGFDVELWDVSGRTTENPKYDNQVRWSPLLSSKTFDRAKRTAKRLVEAGRDPGSRPNDAFWNQQSQSLLAPALFAAFLAGKDYETALAWTLAWDDPTFNEVDQILLTHEETGALHAWQNTRKMLLSKVNDTEWAEQKGLGGAAGTGLSISATLAGLMLSLQTESAHVATRDPNFDPLTWVRPKVAKNAALFLIGDQVEKGTTRSLLATMLHELLSEANNYALGLAGGRLPYRLVFIGDELANLAPIPEIEEFFSTARSTGIQLIVMFQSYSQIKKVYTPEVATILLDAAACTLVLAGISDSEFISKVQTMTGTRQYELNEGVNTTGALLDGAAITGLRLPDPETGAPGQGFLLMAGGVAKVELPFGALHEPFAERWELHPANAESVEKLRAIKERETPWTTKLSKLAKAKASAWNDSAARRDRHRAPDTTGPTTSSADAATEPPTESPVVTEEEAPVADVVAEAAAPTAPPAAPPTAPPAPPRAAPTPPPAPAEEEGVTTTSRESSSGAFSPILDLDGAGTTGLSAAGGAWTRVHASVFGLDAWFARLTATDPKVRFKRDWIKPDKSGLTGSDKSGTIAFHGPLTDGIYEWRDFCVASTASEWRSSGFAEVRDGLVRQVLRDEVVELVKAFGKAAKAPAAKPATTPKPAAKTSNRVAPEPPAKASRVTDEPQFDLDWSEYESNWE